MTTARGPPPATITGLPLELGAAQELDRDVEGVHVEVSDRSGARTSEPSSGRAAGGRLHGADGLLRLDLPRPLRGHDRRALVPGEPGPAGCIGTTAVGILGALLGGWLATELDLGKVDDFFDLETWLIAIGGSFLLLLVFSMLGGGSRRR